MTGNTEELDAALAFVDDLTATFVTYEDYHNTEVLYGIGLASTFPHEDALAATDAADRVADALLALAGDAPLLSDHAAEMKRVLRGDVTPENTTLPESTLADHKEAEKHDPNPEVRDAMKETNQKWVTGEITKLKIDQLSDEDVSLFCEKHDISPPTRETLKETTIEQIW